MQFHQFMSAARGLRSPGQFRTISSEQSTTHRRPPPRELLQRQALRDVKVAKPNSSQHIIASLKDIGSLFNPSASNSDDEEIELAEKRESIQRRIDSGELEQLLRTKLGMNKIDRATLDMQVVEIPTKSITKAFPALTAKDRELLDTSLSLIPAKKSWKDIPFFQKQLLFYVGYGSYGARHGLTFIGAQPEDFLWTKRSKSLKHGDVVRRLSNDEKRNLRTCSSARNEQYQKAIRTLDPVSRAVVWLGLIASFSALICDFKRDDDEDATITAARFC
ncbi:LAMI_0G09010g1_1 [Lachancea mirantina]|uniref:LAMI_0G09010g1_1 n=1 Tax=Lachancea mirantina TaxID=1230905 RepID=A0A1G4KA56_9SACH|nr:LAMI_0G09010g1_1 [Lachancea mirantina]